jgi:WD40 repeat protein
VTATRRNNLAASVGRDRVITLWDAARGEKLWELPPLDREVTCLALSPDGHYLAGTGYKQLLKVWDTRLRQEVLPPFVPERPSTFRNAFAVAFSPDGSSFVAGSEVLQVWDIGTREYRLLFGTGGLRCSRITFSPDDKRLVATYRDGLVRVWDVASGKVILHNKSGADLGADLSPDGEHLALTRERGVTILALTPPKAEPCRTLLGHGPGRVCALAFSADGRLASRGSDGSVVLWDLDAGRPGRTLACPAVPEEANLAFTQGGRQLLSPCEGDRLLTWGADTGREGAVTVPVRNARCCAVSHDGRRLATADANNVIRLGDLGTGRQRTFERVKGNVRCLAFRPGDRQLASCGSDGVTLWETATGREVRTYRGQTLSVACVAFSPDGRLMASASDDSTVRLWDVDRGEALFTLRRHDGPVTAVAFGPGGTRLASASRDGTVKLWDTDVGKVVLTLRGHDGPVTGVAFSPDGHWLATGSHDGSVRLWDGRPLPPAP